MKIMKKPIMICCVIIAAISFSCINATASDLIDKVIERYSVFGFSAAFIQESVLKAMDITDTARGTVYFRRPGKMRWEYDKPEPQLIVSNGSNLWIYKPYENQVMTGKAPDLFGDGKGASFLSDIATIRDRFSIAPYTAGEKEKKNPDQESFSLIPIKKHPDFAEIIIYVNINNFDIESVETKNVFGDITRIRMKDIRFYDSKNAAMSDEMFGFKIPAGADVVQLQE